MLTFPDFKVELIHLKGPTLFVQATGRICLKSLVDLIQFKDPWSIYSKKLLSFLKDIKIINSKKEQVNKILESSLH